MEEKDNVVTLNNRYTKHLKQKQMRQQQRARRIGIITFIGMLSLVALLAAMWGNVSKAQDLAQQIVTVDQQRQTVRDEKAALNAEIERLNTTEYVLQLARSKYFYGKENELIFNLPKPQGEQAETNAAE